MGARLRALRAHNNGGEAILSRDEVSPTSKELGWLQPDDSEHPWRVRSPAWPSPYIPAGQPASSPSLEARHRRPSEHGGSQPPRRPLPGIAPWEQHRLRYALHQYHHLRRLLLAAYTFIGSVSITLSVITPTPFLVLNSFDLVVDTTLVILHTSDHEIRSKDVVFDAEDELLMLRFPDLIPLGNAVLDIDLSVVLNDHIRCFIGEHWKWVVGSEPSGAHPDDVQHRTSAGHQHGGAAPATCIGRSLRPSEP